MADRQQEREQQQLKRVLAENDFKFKKAFGQNFLTDENLLFDIVSDAGVTQEDTVVEIGAGAGTLTRAISSRAKRVVSFEIDEKLKPVLQKTLKDCPNVELVFRDILKTPKEELERLGKFKVVANLPYYITTPIVMYLLENVDNIESITVMVQKEVADRLCASETQGDYGAISVAVDFYGKATLTRLVPRTMFYPAPNVDSAVVHIEVERGRIETLSKDTFFKTVKAAFAMRRKTLSNNLMAGFSLSREEVNEIIQSIGKPVSVRGEQLSVADFAKLADALYAREQKGAV